MYIRPGRVTPELVEALYEPSADPGALNCFVEVYCGDPGPRPESIVTSLSCPVLLLWGDTDQWTPVDGVLARWFRTLAAERPQQVTFELVPRCGHVPFDDAPDDVLALARPWLARVTAQQTTGTVGELPG